MRTEPIDADLVRRLVEMQFPQWAGLALRKVEPGGWDNRSFRLGDGMVVRLPSSQLYSAQVEKEQQWLPVLAPNLPLPIPVPLALGKPGEGYPWHWSVYGWIEGETLSRDRMADPLQIAHSLAAFLRSLQRVDSSGGPPPGLHNFHRGGPLQHYDGETRSAIASLEASIDASEALPVWEAALNSAWTTPPVWLHGDMSSANLLVRNGELTAVIDFGCCAVGDSACDLTPAWSFFTPSERTAFRAEMAADSDTWDRGRGWALWKAAITLAAGGDARHDAASFMLAQVLRDRDRPD